MKLLVVIVILACCNLNAAITFVNGTAAADDSGTTTVVTSAISHTSGNLLVVTAGVTGTDCLSVTLSISNTAGDTWTKVLSSHYEGFTGGFSFCMNTWYVASTAGNVSDVITFGVGIGSTPRYVSVLQFSGVAVLPFGTNTAGDKSIGTGTLTSSSFSTSVANELVIFGAISPTTTGSWALGAIGGTTASSGATGSSASGINLQEYRVVPSAGSITAAASSTDGSANIAGLVVTFKPLVVITCKNYMTLMGVGCR